MSGHLIIAVIFAGLLLAGVWDTVSPTTLGIALAAWAGANAILVAGDEE